MTYVIRTTQAGVTYAKYQIDREPRPGEEVIPAALYQQIEVPCAVVEHADGSYTIAPAEPPVFPVEAEPLPPVPLPEPTTEDDLMALVIDLEYRTTLLELGVI